MTVYVNGIAVIGPGLQNDAKSMLILRGEETWIHEEYQNIRPVMLPANERRRTPLATNLALQAIQGLLREQDDLRTVATVFASSDGELDIVDKICTGLAEDNKIISPTLFHNSVHNAAAGYWSIAAAMQGSSTSLSAADATFMCGLQEAVTRVETEGGTVLFVAYDHPAANRLDKYRHFAYPLAMALRLGVAEESGVFGTLKLEGSMTGQKNSRCRNPSLEVLRTGLPIGCGLPLVEALSQHASMQIMVPYLRDELFCLSVSHEE